MYSIQELQRSTGFTVNQVRDRLQLLSPLFADGVQRGKHGKILVTDGILAALRRMREIESQGLSPKVAQSEIIREVGSAYKDGTTAFGEGFTRTARPGPPERADGPEDLIQALRSTIDQQRETIAWLRSRVDELTPLALPKPRGILRWLWPIRAAR